MREQVGNLVSGIFINFDNPFIHGDYIKVNDVEGVVREVNLRDTIINGTGSEKTVIPNSTLMNNPMKNYTKGKNTKTSIQTQIKPEKLGEKAKLLREAAEKTEKVLNKPEPEIVFLELDEKMKTELHYWVKNPSTVKQVRSSVLDRYTEKLKENNLLEKEKDSKDD